MKRKLTRRTHSEPIPVDDLLAGLTGCDGVVPMATHVARVLKQEGVCPPCTVAPAVDLYRETLRGTKEQGALQALTAARRGKFDAAVIARALDTVKARVHDKGMREQLTKVDCFLQQGPGAPGGQ